MNQFIVKSVKSDTNEWTWITGEGSLNKHDGIRNERKGEVYSVHTEDMYEAFYAIWAGSGGIIPDIQKEDKLSVISSLVGEFE